MIYIYFYFKQYRIIPSGPVNTRLGLSSVMAVVGGEYNLRSYHLTVYCLAAVCRPG